MKKNLASLIIVVLILLTTTFICCLPESIREKITKKKATNANPSDLDPALNHRAEEAIREKVLDLFNDMTTQQISIYREGIEKYLYKNFDLNLKAYNEGAGLIDSQIEPTKRKEIIKKILDDIIYKKTRIPFLTKTGYTTSSIFEAREEYWDLGSSFCNGLKEKIYIN